MVSTLLNRPREPAGDGAGLEASTTDYAAILARAVQANAGIWAKELKVVAGANQVAADASSATPTARIAGTSARRGASSPAALTASTDRSTWWRWPVARRGTPNGAGVQPEGASCRATGRTVRRSFAAQRVRHDDPSYVEWWPDRGSAGQFFWFNRFSVGEDPHGVLALR